MIINTGDLSQRHILINKCFFLTTAQIMHDFEKKGYQNAANEAVNVIKAYHDIVQKKAKNNFSKDYNEAFAKIDKAIDLGCPAIVTIGRSVSFTNICSIAFTCAPLSISLSLFFSSVV